METRVNIADKVNDAEVAQALTHVDRRVEDGRCSEMVRELLTDFLASRRGALLAITDPLADPDWPSEEAVERALEKYRVAPGGIRKTMRAILLAAGPPPPQPWATERDMALAIGKAINVAPEYPFSSLLAAARAVLALRVAPPTADPLSDPLSDPRVKRLVEAAKAIDADYSGSRSYAFLIRTDYLLASRAALAPFRAPASANTIPASGGDQPAVTTRVPPSVPDAGSGDRADDLSMLAERAANLCSDPIALTEAAFYSIAVFLRALATHHRAQAAAAKDVAATAQVVGKVYTAKSTRDAWRALAAWAATMGGEVEK